ncbi:hypothetical protein D3C72_1681510 [compost metagenome]
MQAFGDLLDERVLEDFTVSQGHVRRDSYALALCIGDDVAVLQVRVQFDLVGGDVLGTDGRNRLLHQVDGEVGHADLPGQAQALGFEQGAHEFCDRHLIVRRRPVDQGQVQVIGPQFAQAFFQTVDQAITGQVGDPDLAGDEQFVTGDAAGSDGFADVGLVLVDLCGIDHPVAERQGGAHRIDDHLALQAKGTQAEGGNRHQ